ncbi:helix-turn-helix domain-containing protein [Amycolatopsis sp. cg5]|uniref:helix-turn-helix domain-containing protein n=1 Tax=Amycolatopsis sp. cg5 TaxID=3238802 RepID=UPI003523F3E1
MDIEEVLDEVGPRLKRLRRERGTTLAALAEQTGISSSTLSRLESGQRRATLELLLTLARAYQVPLDDLVGAPPPDDPRVQIKATKFGRFTAWRLTAQPGQPQALKLLMHPEKETPVQRTHEGYEWLYVLSGRVRALLGDQDFTMGPGEAAEFDTHFPHWFGADGGPAEVLVLFGKQGEKAHLKARARRGQSSR